jgi:hypothetical protein
LRFLAYGLLIDSVWPILGAIPVVHDAASFLSQPDIQIIESPSGLTDSQVQHGRTFIYEERGVGRFCCESGKRIVVTPFHGVQEFELLGALIATAIPAILWMRGEIVLHAASVQLKGDTSAIAIAGASGSGKSMLLAQLVSAGASVIGDDTLLARAENRMVHVSGLPACYFRRPELPPAGGEREICVVPDERQLPNAQLTALLVLEFPRSVREAGFHRLEGVSALEALLGCRHRSWIPRQLRSEGVTFQRTFQFLERVQVYTWHRTEGRTAIDDNESSFLNSVCGGIS